MLLPSRMIDPSPTPSQRLHTWDVFSAWNLSIFISLEHLPFPPFFLSFCLFLLLLYLPSLSSFCFQEVERFGKHRCLKGKLGRRGETFKVKKREAKLS